MNPFQNVNGGEKDGSSSESDPMLSHSVGICLYTVPLFIFQVVSMTQRKCSGIELLIKSLVLTSKSNKSRILTVAVVNCFSSVSPNIFD